MYTGLIILVYNVVATVEVVIMVYRNSKFRNYEHYIVFVTCYT